MRRPHPLALIAFFAGFALQCRDAPAQTAPLPPLTLDVILDETDSFTPVLPKVQWVPGTTLYSQVLSGRRGPYVVLRDAARGGQREHAFSTTDLAAALRAAGVEHASDTELPDFQWLDGKRIRVHEGDVVYHWQVGSTAAARRLRLPPGATPTVFATDDSVAACVVDGDLWIAKADGPLRRVTWDGRPGDIEYGGAAHRQEFGIERGLFFDRSGRWLAFYREDLRPIAPYPYVDYAQTPPVAMHGRYPMAGRTHSRVTVGLYDSRDDSVRFLAHEEGAAGDVYWTCLTFTPSGDALVVALVNRGQDQLELVRFDCATGQRAAVLLREHDPQWVEPERGPWFEPGDGGNFLWLSPRDGFRHLYRYAADGKLLGQVTRGSFDVSDVLAISPDGKAAFVDASGDDPRQSHLWRVDLGGAGMQQLTAGRGMHLATPSHDASYFLVRSSTRQSPGNLRVLAADGNEVCVVAEATSRVREFAMPERTFFDLQAADGTPLHGALSLPPDFDEHKTYPLLLYVYGGPHSQMATDAWSLDGKRALWLAWLAAQGCIVATVDNRGTRNRGIEFEQVVHRRLGQVEVEDQIAAVRHLVERGFVDRSRIGVHGWSYGGYVTLRLLAAAPDLFCCGAAGAPVTAWEQYETGYTERYLDTPQENPEGYAAASALAGVAKIKARLLLLHGSDDRTVMLSHALAFLDAAVRHGVLVDSMLYPMQRHSLAGASSNHLHRLLSRFFGEHLLRASSGGSGK